MTQDTHTRAARITIFQRAPSQHESVQSSGYTLPHRLLLTITTFPNGGLSTSEWECGCWVETYHHNTDLEKFTVYDAWICDTHFSPPKNPVPWCVRSDHTHFYYHCRNCGFPLAEGEEFGCEAQSTEVHNEIPGPNNVEYFGGSAEGIDNCPLCNHPIDYIHVYSQWEDFRMSY